MSNSPNVTVNKKRTCKPVRATEYQSQTYVKRSTVSEVIVDHVANIYIMTFGNHCKIGVSQNVERRRKDLARKYRTIKIHSVFTPFNCTALSVEQGALKTLRKFKTDKMPGREWLECSPYEVEDAIIEAAKCFDKVYVCNLLRPVVALIGAPPTTHLETNLENE